MMKNRLQFLLENAGKQHLEIYQEKRYETCYRKRYKSNEFGIV